MIKLCADIIDKNDIENLIAWLRTIPKLTKGEKTLTFEERFASIVGCKHAVFCNSGSSANLLATSALVQSGLMGNNKIVVPQVSWSTTVFPAMQLGLQPIMCDCNLSNLGIDIDNLLQIIEKEKPSALILVHVLGFDSNIRQIKKICEDNNILLIEDTCESLGSVVDGKMLGSYGLASTFSFYFGHHISTIEGGMVCTNDDHFAEILKMIRSHGWDRDIDEEAKQKYKQKYNVNEFESLYKFYYQGFNLRSTDLQAFIGINQLAKVKSIVEKRHQNFSKYLELIDDRLWKPSLDQEVVSNMGYPLLLSNREAVYSELKANKIECRPLVSGSMGTQPAWSSVYGESKMKNSSVVNNQGMYVPNHNSLSYEDIEKVCEIINKYGDAHV
jgi:CDP-6-deoxy-D-xylo-4-hexulose-3-dehydrase